MAINIGKALKRAGTLTLADWRYLAIATKELFIARVCHATQPVGKILQQLQTDAVRVQSGARASAREVLDVQRLSWAIGVAAKLVPWRSDCLLQVMAADRWLLRHQCPADFYLGVAKDTAGTLKAHAWLRHENFLVTGGNCEEFTTLIDPPI